MCLDGHKIFAKTEKIIRIPNTKFAIYSQDIKLESMIVKYVKLIKKKRKRMIKTHHQETICILAEIKTTNI